MMYEVTFKVIANDKADALDKVLKEILDNNSTIEVKEQKIDGNAILNWVTDNMPNTSEILFRTANTAIIFSTYNQAQMTDLANHLYSAFEDFARDNKDEDCTTVEGLFNFCITQEVPDFGIICSIYYKNDFDNSFIFAF